MTKKYNAAKAAKEYKEMSIKFAEIISQINDMHVRCGWLDQKTESNLDPSLDLEVVLTHCARALSSLVIYADEFEKESTGDSNDIQ